MTIQKKADLHIPVVLFQYAVGERWFWLLGRVDDILKYDYSNESYGAVLKVVLFSLWMKPYGVTIQMKPPQQHIYTVLFIQYM